MTKFDLSNKRAVITGGARGMGFAIAEKFIQSSAQVSLWDVRTQLLAEAQAKLAAEVDIRSVDVSDYSQVEAAASAVEQALGGIDILVNAAGIAGVNALLQDYPLEAWNDVININLNGTFHTCRAIVPIMQKANYGRIANIASIAGKEGNPNASAYSVSKAGVIGLTKSLGKEMASSNIRVNVLTPAVVRTEMLADVSAEHLQYMLSKIPMGRTGSLDEIAAMISFMCSDECSYTTGAVFDLSGGRATY